MTGDTVRHYSNHSKDKETQLKDIEAGSNLHNWNMRYGNAKKFEGMIFWWGSLNGAKATPGVYKVVMAFNGQKEEHTFNIKSDPRLDMSYEDFKAQENFINSVNVKVTQSHEAIIEMRKLKKQMASFKSDHKNEEIEKKISVMDSTLTVIEKELYQTQNKSRQDPLNFPIRLTNKLAHLNSLVQMGDAVPTTPMFEVRDELIQRIDVQLNKYYELRDNELNVLNKLIRDNISDFIKLDKKEIRF